MDGVDILSGKSHDEILIDIGAWNPVLKHNAHAIRRGEMKYLRAVPFYDGWYKDGYIREKPDEGAGLKNCSGGCMFNLTADPHERNNLKGIHHIKDWLELTARIDEVMVSGDWMAWQENFFHINVSAVNLTINGHRIYWPYLEPLPNDEDQKKHYASRASFTAEQELQEMNSDDSIISWFMSAL